MPWTVLGIGLSGIADDAPPEGRAPAISLRELLVNWTVRDADAITSSRLLVRLRGLPWVEATSVESWSDGELLGGDRYSWICTDFFILGNENRIGQAYSYTDNSPVLSTRFVHTP